MKDLILKNKKISCIISVALAILFFILAIANLTGVERTSYQAMYDANKSMYDSYIEVAEKYESYGYSSKAQSYYLKANSEKADLDRYQDKLSSLNIKLAIYAILAIGSATCFVLILKNKNEYTNSERVINESIPDSEI